VGFVGAVGSAVDDEFEGAVWLSCERRGDRVLSLKLGTYIEVEIKFGMGFGEMDVWGRTVFVKAEVVLCRFALNGNNSMTEELDNAKIEARSVELRLLDKVPWMDSFFVELEAAVDKNVVGKLDEGSFVVENDEFHDAVNVEKVMTEVWGGLTEKI
jgi:hypothetical protein